jgi:hypothetical protein
MSGKVEEAFSRCRLTTTRRKIVVTADGAGVVSQVGSRLLADVADRTTLTGELAEALGGLRKQRTRYDPGRVLVDLAVAVADGATTLSDMAVLADQAALCGASASDSTCWRLLDEQTTLGSRLRGLGRGRWSGPSTPRSVTSRSRRCGSPRDLRVLVIDPDASLSVSEVCVCRLGAVQDR